MTRAYLRLDPGFYERKLEQGYPIPAIAAYIGCLCLAEHQSQRGYFRDRSVLRALLGVAGARWVAYLLEHGDLLELPGGRVYVDGWEEWQEGDVTVKDRMAMVRQRQGVPAPASSPGAVRTARWRVRNAVFERDQYTCRYCGAPNYPREWLVLEHVDPRGPTDEQNCVTACRPCNKRKGSKSVEAAGMVMRPVPESDVSRDALRDASPPSLAGAGRGADKAGQPGRYMNDAHKAFRHVTGHDPDDTEKKWLAELCRDLGREAVINALYDDPTPQRGVLGRISKILRKGKAA